jgi:biotin carboxyl carrier protein
MIYTYQHNEQAYTVHLDPQPDGSYKVIIGDRTYSVQATPLAEGGWRLLLKSLTPLPSSSGKLRTSPSERGEKDTPDLAVDADQTAYRKDTQSAAGKSQIVYTAAQGDKRFVSLGGQDYTLTVPDARTSRRRTAGSSGDLTAQMPGQVVTVLVNEGDAVERGQTLVILEAMKMEIRVSAPGGGRVKRLLVQTGQVVERGQLLLEIEKKI